MSAERPIPAEVDGWETPVHDRHQAEFSTGDDVLNFQAMVVQARHVTSCSYETTLYDHQQAFRLLWRHLERTGYLRRVRHGADNRLRSDDLTARERADLDLLLTIYDGVHPS
ncbi:hypothetical protein [Streptomyces sp. S584]|uniref:hypothetical protein n=1 Tax=Streptomyces sp. S584 TaxID=3096010 RepID=UPI002AFE36EC|nr:hypothetical protein [Streptomyces sp. S584]